MILQSSLPSTYSFDYGELIVNQELNISNEKLIFWMNSFYTIFSAHDYFTFLTIFKIPYTDCFFVSMFKMRKWKVHSIKIKWIHITCYYYYLCTITIYYYFWVTIILLLFVRKYWKTVWECWHWLRLQKWCY